MNVTKPPLSRVFFIVCLLFTATSAQAEAEYTFTLIADSAGAFMEFRAAPSISMAGTVAFNAILDNGAQGIFTGNGGTVTTIALPTGIGGFERPTINAAGTVAFLATQGNFVDDRIVADNGGPLVTIADTAGQFKNFAAGYTASIHAYPVCCQNSPAGPIHQTIKSDGETNWQRTG